MLVHLHIRNVAIIEESSFSLDSGLNVFTGETGAGKSILIDSLLLALGGRASTDLVRTGTEEARVSALFSIDQKASYTQQLDAAGIPVDDELLLRRIISANGRSRAYINERPVTVAFLREIGKQLCEISGQHEHQHLLHPRLHLSVLDSYGELVEERKAVTTQYESVRSLRKELDQLGGDAHNRARRRGYLQYQIDELEEAELDANEEELEHQRKYMLQIEQMIESSQEGDSVLYSGPSPVLDQIGKLQHRLSHFRELSEELDNAHRSLEEAEALLDDAARTLRNFSSDSSFDPNELEELQERLTRLRDLKRKHGVHDVEGLSRCLQSYKEELLELDGRETRMETLESNYHKEVKILQNQAWELSQKRNAISDKLAADVEHELASLGMKKATFVVKMTTIERQSFEEDIEQPSLEESIELYSDVESITPIHQEPLPGPNGYDQAQFLLSSNPGEEARPMHKIASGGELSRITLALKQVIAERDPVATCIFDEVDAGIGGITGATIGHKINEIARTRQVLCITHLPQIACFAQHHFHIHKMEEEGRTHSTIQALPTESREEELARMLGGMSSNKQSLAHARELLQQAQKHSEDLSSESKTSKKTTKHKTRTTKRTTQKTSKKKSNTQKVKKKKTSAPSKMSDVN